MNDGVGSKERTVDGTTSILIVSIVLILGKQTAKHHYASAKARFLYLEGSTATPPPPNIFYYPKFEDSKVPLYNVTKLTR